MAKHENELSNCPICWSEAQWTAYIDCDEFWIECTCCGLKTKTCDGKDKNAHAEKYWDRRDGTAWEVFRKLYEASINNNSSLNFISQIAKGLDLRVSEDYKMDENEIIEYFIWWCADWQALKIMEKIKEENGK